MSQAQYLGPDHEFEGVAAADFQSGQVIVAPDGRHGVITSMVPVLAGQRYRATTVGRFLVNCLTTATFNANAIVYWDNANQRATNSNSGTTPLGRAAAAKVSGPATVEVLLNGQGPTA